MAAVLFSWKKGVETSTLSYVIFMAVFAFFRAGRLFNFMEAHCRLQRRAPIPPLSLEDTREFTRLHGGCMGVSTGTPYKK